VWGTERERGAEGDTLGLPVMVRTPLSVRLYVGVPEPLKVTETDPDTVPHTLWTGEREGEPEAEDTRLGLCPPVLDTVTLPLAHWEGEGLPVGVWQAVAGGERVTLTEAEGHTVTVPEGPMERDTVPVTVTLALGDTLGDRLTLTEAVTQPEPLGVTDTEGEGEAGPEGELAPLPVCSREPVSTGVPDTVEDREPVPEREPEDVLEGVAGAEPVARTALPVARTEAEASGVGEGEGHTVAEAERVAVMVAL
jgi:hypothetical protein